MITHKTTIKIQKENRITEKSSSTISESVIILLSLFVVFIREGSANIPNIDILRILKYPVGFLLLVIILVPYLIIH